MSMVFLSHSLPFKPKLGPVFSNKTAGKRALENTSTIFREFQMYLEEIARQSPITLIWVPGRRVVDVEYTADFLPKFGATLVPTELGGNIGINQKHVPREVYNIPGKVGRNPLLSDLRRTRMAKNLSRAHLGTLLQ